MFFYFVHDIVVLENGYTWVAHMKKALLYAVFIGLLILSGCKNIPTEEEITIPDCDIAFNMTKGDYLPILALSIPYSEVKGNQDNFINPCKAKNINPLILTKSSIRTHQIIWTFDATYPVDQIEIQSNIETLSIEISLDNQSFTRIKNQITPINGVIDLGGTMVRALKLIIPVLDDDITLDDVRFKLDEGLIIKEDTELTKQFLRYNGWSGADGIFTFNLTNGDETIGANKDTVGFIFSDTFVGEVYEHNNLRKSSVMINNSLGYMDTSKNIDEAFSFDYKMIGSLPKSVFTPEHYIGLVGRNLLDGDGLSVSQKKNAFLSNSSEGLGYRSNTNQATIIIDLKERHDLGSITIWNDNSNPGMGTKKLNISYSNDNITYTDVTVYELDQASGSNQEPYTLDIEAINQNARYIKLDLVESYDANHIGLSKLMIFNDEDQFLFGDVMASTPVDTLHTNELSARLWLQDGVVIGNHLYIFPILVKDEADIFKVHNVGLIKAPILNEKINHEDAIYKSTPLQVKTEDGGTIFFGAGILNNVDRDGYIYIYGYKDLAGRHLVVGRFLPEDIENFNQWTYFNGESFVSDINQVVGLKDKVSAELSVTYIPSGIYEGKYMLTVMENTTSGKISYAIADTPYEPFGEYTQVYETNVSHLRGAFTYNAKMHPALSKPGEYVISYNVNTTLLGALSDANIYYPRFIRMIEVKK